MEFLGVLPNVWQDSATEVVEERYIDSVGREGVEEVAANEASSAYNQHFLQIFRHFFINHLRSESYGCEFEFFAEFFGVVYSSSVD